MTKNRKVRNVTFWEFLYEAGAQRKITFKNLMNFLDMEIRLNLSKVKKKNLSPSSDRSKEVLSCRKCDCGESQAVFTPTPGKTIQVHVYSHIGL